VTVQEPTHFPLWSAEPAVQDLLSLSAVASTVADTLFDDGPDPVAIGLSGAWGSGKTSVLGLVAQELDRPGTPENKALAIQTDPWRYDPATGIPSEQVQRQHVRSVVTENGCLLSSHVIDRLTQTRIRPGD
jgi:Ni2+-binding GTPase involved in maturation of urease and hydrogenase